MHYSLSCHVINVTFDSVALEGVGVHGKAGTPNLYIYIFLDTLYLKTRTYRPHGDGGRSWGSFFH